MRLERRTDFVAMPGARARVSQLPGIRTFRSERFRMFLAATLLLVSVPLLVLLLARQASDPAGQYGIDFAVFHAGAIDIASGASPYPREFLEAPIKASDFGFKYSPAFAHALVPLGWLPLPVAATVWAAIQTLLAVAGVWIAGSLGGGARTLERVLWTGVAVALYLPFWDSVWKGNMSAAQAFLVAVMFGGGAAAGASLAAATLMKTAPAALLPAAVARGGHLLVGAAFATVAVVAFSAALAPRAWAEFVLIQPNLFFGPSADRTNLHPASLVATTAPEQEILVVGVRVATLALGFTCVVASMIVARRPSGWPAAVVIGTAAMLLIPAAAWYHYLALLLPLGAYAWPGASARSRAMMVAGAGSVTLGLAWLPLATAGATLLTVGALLGVLSRDRAGETRA